MKRRIFAGLTVLLLCISVFTGCGEKAEESASIQEPKEEVVVENSSEAPDNDMTELNAVGDVEVDKGLFNVTLTIPKDFIGDTTQEKLDDAVKEKGYKSATLNSDGSVTYVITKEQHKEMIDAVKKSIDDSLAEMKGSEDYPNITNVAANSDYTSFTITTKNEEPDLSESFAVMGLYMLGGMYGIFSGKTVDNVHVDFVNDASGKIISSADSKDMGIDEE